MRVVDLSFPIRPHFRWKAPAACVATRSGTVEISAAELEYLTNLDGIGAARCRFIALPLRIETADGSPVRAVAIVDP